MKKRIVVALGHKALGTTLPEQKSAVKRSAEVLADIVEEGYQLAVCHDPHSYERVWQETSGLYRGAHVRLLCDEPGLYRI
mgnify:CR=1 FL=1